MKVILLKDIAKVGKRFDTKEVSDCYGLNYLIPNGLAEPATAKTLKRIEEEKNREATERAIREKLLLKNVEDLDDKRIELNRKANEKGHLFAAVNEGDLVEEIKKQTGLDINPQHILLKEHLKEVGEHEVEVRGGEKTAKMKVVINALAD